MRKFFQFAALAGCGWLLDFCLLLALVRLANAPAAVANVISSMTAAFAVFLVSRLVVFDAASGRLYSRLALYALYTLGVILVASVAVGALTAWLPTIVAAVASRAITPLQAAAGAKILVTPPQLLLNFSVSRLIAERSRFSSVISRD